MSKYDRMLALNKQASDEKIERAKKAILQMLDAEEKVTVSGLVIKTGLSRGFFYKNPEVRQALDRAMEQQVGMSDPRKNILDLAMDSEIATLHQKINILQKEKEELQKENERLRKALERKNRDLLKNL